ncbi:uncharacterized protein LOC134252319 [Saccostrea cucullata]|uniref:uncharacterized protein LOC134252319 n=1 Tax=Saccostrea cuccullata TaxID=36930 RepID=UPI002ED3D271
MQFRDLYANLISSKECLAGYFGFHCSQVCRYPTYGEKCSRMCTCDRYTCDFSRGCVSTLENSPSSTQFTLSASRLTSTTGIGSKSDTLTSLFLDSIKASATHQIYSTLPVSKKCCDEKQRQVSLTFVLQISTASIVFLFFFFQILRSVWKIIKSLRAPRITLHRPRKPSRDTDHYHCLEEFEQTFPPLNEEENTLFDGPADVKIKVNKDKKYYSVTFQTTNNEGRDICLSPRKKIYENTHEAIDKNDKCACDMINENAAVAIMTPKGIIHNEQGPFSPQSGYIEMKAKIQRKEFVDPYLLVVNGD